MTVVFTGCEGLFGPKQVTITFDSNGGTSVAAQEVDLGASVTEPNAPTRTGYTFVGWFQDEALTTAWQFADDLPTEDMTLYAKWAPVDTDTSGDDTSGQDTSGDDTSDDPSGDDASGEDSGDDPAPEPTAPRSLWGTWIRMDTGASCYVAARSLTSGSGYSSVTATISSANDTSFTADGVTYTAESPSVIDGGNFKLYREGGAARSFTARVAGFSDTIAARAINMPKADIPITRANPRNSADTEETTTDTGGTAAFTHAVADDPQVLEVEYAQATGDTGDTDAVTATVSVEVTPEYDGQFVGTIPLVESGPSFKTTYAIDSSQLENGYLYANGFDTYELTIEIENIGDADARTSLWQITMPTGLHTSSRLDGNFSSTPPGDSEDIALFVSAGAIESDYEDFEIKIEITDSVSLRTWEDYVVLRFFRTPVSVRTRAYSLDGNASAELKSFLIGPDGRSMFVETAHNTVSTTLVPYRTEGYTMVLSGAGYDSEMKYSFAVNAAPTSLTNDTWFIEQIARYRAYDSETDAYAVSDARTPVDGFLGVGEYNYFDIDLTSVAEESAPSLVYHAHAADDVGGNADGIPNPGETMRLDVRIHNASRSPKTTLTAELTTTSEHVTIANGSFAYGTVGAGLYDTIAGTTSSTPSYAVLDPATASAFTFTIDAATPFDTVVPFTLTMTDSAGNTWTDEFSVTVVQTGASLAYDAHALDDVGGNADGIPNPGESMTMDVRIHNSGTSKAPALSATLSAPATYITITKGTATYGDLRSGLYDTIADAYPDATAASASLSATHPDAFTFDIDAATPFDTVVPFTLTMTDSAGNTWTDEFSVTVAAMVIPAVQDLAVTPETTPITLAWTNPTFNGFDVISVVRKTDSAPTGPSDGVVIYTGTAETYVDSGLGTGTYYYAVFVHDIAGRASDGSQVNVPLSSVPLSIDYESGSMPSAVSGDWVISSNSSAGSYSMMSPNLRGGESSAATVWLEAPPSGRVRIVFDHSASSVNLYDRFLLFVNDVQAQEWMGSYQWQTFDGEFTVTPGTLQSLRWSYVRNSTSYDSGSSPVWVDSIVIEAVE